MKLKREPGTCFWCGDRRRPHPWKACPANGKTCTKCRINNHFSGVCLETNPLQQEQPQRTTQWQPQGRGQGHRTPRGCSQPRPPQEQNIHLLQTTNDQHPVTYYTDDYQEQCYSLETRQIQCPYRPHKEKILCYPAHVHNWEQIHPSDIPDRYRCHLQYLVRRCPSQADAKYEAHKVTLPTPPLRRLPATETAASLTNPTKTGRTVTQERPRTPNP